MQTLKKATEKSKKEKSRDGEFSTKNSQDEKLKRNSSHNVTTPRNYIQKSSTADIYGLKNKNAVQGTRAPKKLSSASNKTNDESPMRDLLKSSSSSVSVASKVSDSRFKKGEAKATPRQSMKVEAKATPRQGLKVEAKVTPRTVTKTEAKATTRTIKVETKATPRTVTKTEAKEAPRTTRQTPRRDLPFTNVTVSSPAVKRKLNLNNELVGANNAIKLEREKTSIRSINEELLDKSKSKENVELVFERQRTKTRTLNEDEVKILTPEVVDNNAGMMNLSRKLTAKAKAFFVDFEDEQTKKNNNVPSEEDVSYEDDFESYESDFESYHSGSNDEKSSHVTESSEQNDESDDHDDDRNEEHTDIAKEVRDEERMLDSGSYDLRDRSAKSKPSIMENIIEDDDTEDAGDKKVSLTDEGFQEMSSTSAVSSLRTVHLEVSERPLFIDLKKSKEVKRKRRIFERLKKRAEDLLGMISLHEMTYSLFEMKPISYDLFMASFGRQNYLQTGVQTFDDGVSEEVQSDEITQAHKWTQHPVEFSKSDVCLNYETLERKYSVVTVDYLTKFSFLTQNKKQDINIEKEKDESYKKNPLRIYLEQKDGVGSSQILSYEIYKAALNVKKYDSYKLGKFLKKIESRVSNILSLNTGNTDLDLVKSTKFPFSKGYTSLNIKSIPNENYTFLDQSKITHLFFCETKRNLIMTVHLIPLKKCLICLWDASVVKREPAKVLVAVDNVVVGTFRGNTDGVFVAGLEDGTLHLWDLSEQPSCIPDITDEVKSTKLVDIESENLTEFEKDREWNLKNYNIKNYQQFDKQYVLHPCAYTSSALAMINGEVSDRIVGLEFTSSKTVTLEGGRRIVGQVVSLQCTGVLITWTIVQDKNKTDADIGKAYWSKMKLEKSQIIHLIEHIDHSFADSKAKMETFSLNSAKKRLIIKKQERSVSKTALQKSAAIKDFGGGRSSRATSARSRMETKLLPAHNVFNYGLICNDLKIVTVDEVEILLVAKNCGEVLCCRRYLGVFKVHRICVTNEASSVTSLQVSSHGLPHFLAATDTGTVNLCSIHEKKVLHTLDCRNVPPVKETSEKYNSDAKGRFVGSVSVSSDTRSVETKAVSKMCVTSLLWSEVNPCCIYAVLKDGAVIAWDLAQSDIYGRTAGESVQVVAAGDCAMAILTSDDEVQIHRFKDEQRSKDNLELFKKYVALL